MLDTLEEDVGGYNEWMNRCILNVMVFLSIILPKICIVLCLTPVGIRYSLGWYDLVVMHHIIHCFVS